MASPNEHLLAIDLGTSGPKVALFSAGGHGVGSEFEPTKLHLFDGGGAEQDPEDWWRAIAAASRRLVARFPEQARSVVGVCCTAQWSGTVAVDRGGRAIGNSVIWMDSRGAPHVRRITSGFPSYQGYGVLKLAKWIRLTGGIPAHSGKDSLAHVLFLKHERQEVYARTDKFLEPKDYLNLRLTGRTAASFDSMTLHWVTDTRDPAHIAYDRGLLELVGLPREKLPEMLRSIDVLGPVLPEVARELGIPEGAKVVCGSPDVQSAAVGSGAVRDYAPHLYIGTSSWLTSHLAEKKTDPSHNMATILSAVPGRYLIGNEQDCAGVCLTFLRDQVFFAQDALSLGPAPQGAYAAFDRLVEQTPAGSGKVIFTPWLYGERTPVEDPHVRGGFHNVSLKTTRGQLVRSVYEGVALNSRWLFEAVESFTGRKMDAINMIGGGAKSDVWCQIHADVLGTRIRQVADPIEANARGAATIAAVGLGFARFEDAEKRVAILRTYEPNPEHRSLYGGLFREFVRIYRANRAIHARLNRAA